MTSTVTQHSVHALAGAPRLMQCVPCCPVVFSSTCMLSFINSCFCAHEASNITVQRCLLSADCCRPMMTSATSTAAACSMAAAVACSAAIPAATAAQPASAHQACQAARSSTTSQRSAAPSRCRAAAAAVQSRGMQHGTVGLLALRLRNL